MRWSIFQAPFFSYRTTWELQHKTQQPDNEDPVLWPYWNSYFILVGVVKKTDGPSIVWNELGESAHLCTWEVLERPGRSERSRNTRNTSKFGDAAPHALEDIHLQGAIMSPSAIDCQCSTSFKEPD